MTSDTIGVGLEPFGISPDPRFIYFDAKLHRVHQVLLDGLRAGSGLTVVTGGHGVGKTMLLHCLAAELDVADHLVVCISCLGSPSIDEIMGAFSSRIGFPGAIEHVGEQQNRNHVAAMLGSMGVCGTTAILLLDDAHRLSSETLSALSAMTRGDARQGAAIAIVVAGLPSLAPLLDDGRSPLPKKKLGQNISLSALEPADAKLYIYHRLQMAGYEGKRVFAPEAIGRVVHYAQGNPRTINRICRAAMLVAAGQSRKTVSADMVDQVAPGIVRACAPTPASAALEDCPPPTSAGLETLRTIAMTANTQERGIPSRIRSGNSAFDSPAPGPERPIRREDGEFDTDEDASHHGVASAVPSGRDLTDEVAAATYDVDVPQTSRSGPRWRRWAALGVLSVVGAVVLYGLAGTDWNDSVDASADRRADIVAQGGEQGSSSPNPVTAPAPARNIAPGPVAQPHSAPEPEESTLPESWGSPLERAVFLGDIGTVAALLDEGANINAPISGGGTLLMLAADNGDEAMVSYLVHRGANLSLGTPEATAGGSDRLFPDADATLRTTMARELLLSTVGDGDRRASGPTPPASTIDGPGEGTEPKTAPNSGVTPLIAAARGGHTDVVRVLLASGANANVADSRGRTPLMAAVEAGDEDSARLLLARNADVHAVDDAGRTALDRARQLGNANLVRVISVRAEPVVETTTATRLSPESVAPPPEAEKTAIPDRTSAEASAEATRSAARTLQDQARVARTQRYLSLLGYEPGPVDGKSGSNTKSAIVAFQRDAGIRPDGEISDSLLAALMAEANARQATRLADETPAKGTQGTPPRKEGFFDSVLNRLQSLRGLDFDSTRNPGQVAAYCAKNKDTWVYDKGKGRSIFCAEYMRSGNL